MKITHRLEDIRGQLLSLHAEAEAKRLPEGVVMGLRWLCQDTDSVLSHLVALEMQRKQDREEEAGDQPDLFPRN